MKNFVNLSYLRRMIFKEIGGFLSFVTNGRSILSLPEGIRDGFSLLAVPGILVSTIRSIPAIVRRLSLGILNARQDDYSSIITVPTMYKTFREAGGTTQPMRRALMQRVQPDKFKTLYPYWQIKRKAKSGGRLVGNWGFTIFLGYIAITTFAGEWNPDTTVLGYENAEVAAHSIAQLTLQSYGQGVGTPAAPQAIKSEPMYSISGDPVFPTPTRQTAPIVIPTQKIPNTYSAEVTPTFWLASGPYPEKDDTYEFDFPTLGLARYSHYWPPLGGVNCDADCERMASGLAWQEHVGHAVACPVEFPLFTRFITNWGEFTCLDRGGAITFLDDGTFWLDFLEEEQRYPFWEPFSVRIEYP